MPLTGQQITQLVDEIEQQINLPQLELHATNLGVSLASLAPDGSLRERAFRLVSHLNTSLPARDGELLDELRQRGNARLRNVAAQLLRPTFLPAGDPLRAVLLGKTAFVARTDLRAALRDFVVWSNLTTRVLIVRGPEPGGKSYTWEFLRHLAFETGARAVRLRLRGKGTEYTPRLFLLDAFLLLGLNAAVLPVLADDPQLARIEPLIIAFKAQVLALAERRWLVIDDLNEASVTPSVREAAFALAQAVEELRPERLWVALLGYNEPITDPDLRRVAQDDAEFPAPDRVAEHFKVISDASPNPLTLARAREIADILFSKYPKLDKEAMMQLTDLLEKSGELLRRGLHP